MKSRLFTNLFVILMACVCHAQTGWYTQNSGTNRLLFDVCFVDQNTGWVCGQTGTILHTSDGGANWTDLNAPPINYYSGIYFVNDSTGWVVGFGGRIQRTTDSGNTWNMQTSPTQYSISDLYFVNAATGWTVGGKPRTFTNPVREILHTTDGGNNWTTQYAVSNEEPLAAVQFVDENHGWAVGNMSAILHTSDGGNNWTTQMSGTGYQFEDVFFVNPDTGWVVGLDLSLPHFTVIFSTVDGGTTWNSQNFGIDDSFQGIQFVNDSTGWVVGGSSNTGALILHTTDGGINWTPQTAGTSNSLSGVHFVDQNNGWAVGFNGTIIHTTTGGVVGIKDDYANTLPNAFILYDNYPNPFNPSTTIRYALPKAANVTLKIYDILGQEIRTLVNEVQSAGIKSIVWDGRNYSNQPASSGIYIYQLQAGNQGRTKKMILIE